MSMKRLMLKFVSILVLLSIKMNLFAYDFEVDGLCYNKKSDTEVEVTYRSGTGGDYSGNLIIPTTTTYNGTKYIVTSIGKRAFAECSGLTGELSIPNSVISIDSWAFYGCSGLKGDIIIPNSVTTIGEYAFSDCIGFDGSLQLPSNLTTIEKRTFNNCCFLKGQITLPNSITKIGDYAFYRCSSLTGNINFPKSIVSIGAGAFSGCIGLTGDLSIPNSVTNIGRHAFSECVGFDGYLTLSTSLTTIDEGVFYNCSKLKGSLVIPNTVTTIGHSAFRGCTGFGGTLSLSSSLMIISDWAFYGCSALKGNLSIPNSVTKIGKSAFGLCSGFDGNIIIPNSLTTIGQYSFYECRGFNGRIVLPNSITSLELGAFSGCRNIVLVDSYIENPFEIANSVFELSNDAILQVPSQTINKYKELSGWSKPFKEIKERESVISSYTLSIIVAGNGSASYDGTNIRSKTSTFSINEGTNATISFSADNGYRIKSVKVNSSDVTSSVSNNQYTISNIQSNTTIEVEFEAIPNGIDITQYVSAVSIGGAITQINNLINSGSQLNWTFSNKSTESVTLNSLQLIDGLSGTAGNIMAVNQVVDANSSVSYTTTIGAAGIHTPVTCRFRYTYNGNEYSADAVYSDVQSYTLSIKATGNGQVKYNGNIVRNSTKSYSVDRLSSAILTITPDDGYQIKSVKVNNSDVTSRVYSNSYTISLILSNQSVEVEFEAKPPTTYTLSIRATGNGSASFDGTAIRSKTSTFTLNEGASATISFSPDNGYRIKSVLVNSSDVTSSVSSNKYTISNISKNTDVEVVFEKIPSSFTLSITATGNGAVSYDSKTIRSKTESFTVTEGTNIVISINPDSGNRVKSVKADGTDVTSRVSNNQYTISNISKNVSVEVEFQEELKSFESEGLNYTVVSYDDKTIRLSKSEFGTVLEVPATVTYQDITWKVAGIDNAALTNSEELAAIIWNPTAAFTESVSNPNLLLYVKSVSYAPESIKNVIVNGTADEIVLTDAASGNNFYCPKEFTAKKISYTHNYGMITGIGESRGWETIALPFDVNKISHSSKGELTPFANWRSGDSKKPFWLMSYGIGGWTNASNIKANTPYIISMPNNQDYKAEFRLSGNITFSSENVTVKKSDNLQTGNYGGNTFTPNFSNTDNSGYLALNVNNDYVSYNGGSAEGSTFVVNLRPVHPFEAYMTSTSKTRSTISINGDMATGIEDISVLMDEIKGLRIYNLKGQLIKVEQDKNLDEVRRCLPAGVYIVNGKKLIIK